MTTETKPSSKYPSYYYCANSFGYLTQATYDELVRMHRRGIHTVLTLDGERIDMRCIPAKK